MRSLKWDLPQLVLAAFGTGLFFIKPELGLVAFTLAIFVANAIGYAEGLVSGERIWGPRR